MGRLHGATARITPAGQGIGRASASEWARFNATDKPSVIDKGRSTP